MRPLLIPTNRETDFWLELEAASLAEKRRMAMPPVSLEDYARAVYGYEAARHHAVWLDKICAVIEGRSEKRRLLIVAPPGTAKSTWISLIFPPWYLAQHPSHSLLFFTSSDAMARHFGTTVRMTIEGEKHQGLFPRSCPDRERGWSNDGLYLVGAPAGSASPSYRAVGYGASVIGARAHGIILDDPLTQQQAQSAVEQERAKQYHDMTVDSRLHPDGWEIGIMTRWAELDLANHLMNKSEWETVVMPSIGYWAEEEALWPERFDMAWLTAKRMEIGGPLFEAMYQGNTASMGGTVFKEATWFRPLPLDLKRENLSVVQYWDLAYSEKTTADYSVCCTLGIDREGRLYVISVFRKRLSMLAMEEAMIEQNELWQPALVAVEEGAYKQRTIADLIARVRRRSYLVVLPDNPGNRDKVTRALLPAARAEAGLLYVDRQAAWFPVFETECLGFPFAAHDDQVDALSCATKLITERLPSGMQKLEIRPHGRWIA